MSDKTIIIDRKRNAVISDPTKDGAHYIGFDDLDEEQQLKVIAVGLWYGVCNTQGKLLFDDIEVVDEVGPKLQA